MNTADGLLLLAGFVTFMIGAMVGAVGAAVLLLSGRRNREQEPHEQSWTDGAPAEWKDDDA